MAAMAINLALVARATDEDRQARDWTAWVLSQPFGRLLTIMLGVGIALGGIALGAKAIAGDFRSKLPQREPETRWIVMLGRAGFAARGFVLVLIGAFLSMAAWYYEPQQAVGVAGAQISPMGRPCWGWRPSAWRASGCSS
jgi:purine-cytosine permease-like protein